MGNREVMYDICWYKMDIRRGKMYFVLHVIAKMGK